METNEKKGLKEIAKKPALYEAENEEKLDPQADLPTPENLEPENKIADKPKRGRPAKSATVKKVITSKSSDASPAGKRTYKKRDISSVTLNDKSKSQPSETGVQKNIDNKTVGLEDKNVLLESSMNKANLEISNLQKVHNELKRSVAKLDKKIKKQKEKNKKELEKEKDKLKKNKKKSDQKLKIAKLKAKKLKSKKK